MGVKGGPDIVTDGLVFHLDAASSNIGKGYSPEGLRVEYLVVGGGGGGGGYYQNAYFPSLWVYNRALSADEMLQNYHATKGRFGL